MIAATGIHRGGQNDGGGNGGGGGGGNGGGGGGGVDLRGAHSSSASGEYISLLHL